MRYVLKGVSRAQKQEIVKAMKDKVGVSLIPSRKNPSVRRWTRLFPKPPPWTEVVEKYAQSWPREGIVRDITRAEAKRIFDEELSDRVISSPLHGEVFIPARSWHHLYEEDPHTGEFRYHKARFIYFVKPTIENPIEIWSAPRLNRNGKVVVRDNFISAFQVPDKGQGGVQNYYVVVEEDESGWRIDVFTTSPTKNFNTLRRDGTLRYAKWWRQSNGHAKSLGTNISKGFHRAGLDFINHRGDTRVTPRVFRPTKASQTRRMKLIQPTQVYNNPRVDINLPEVTMRYILKGVSRAQLYRIIKSQMSLFGGGVDTRPEKVLVRGKTKNYYAIRHKKKTEAPAPKLFDTSDQADKRVGAEQERKRKKKDARVAAYRQKKEARVQRYKELAEKNRRVAEQGRAGVAEETKHFPGGQPVLAGHSSQRAHERALDRQYSTLRRASEAEKKAEYYERKARAAENNESISSDDPEALEKLRARLEKLESQEARSKELWGLVKKGDRDALAEAVNKPTESEQFDFADRMLAAYRKAPWMERTSYAAAIRSTKKRIAALEQVQERDSSSKEPHEMTSAEYEDYVAKLPEFGDTVITPDGRLGTMRGGRMGSERVEVEDTKGHRTYATIGELRVVNARKKQYSRHHNAADTWLEKVSKEVARLEGENAGLLLKYGVTKRFRRAVEDGTLTQARFDEMVKEGKLLSEEGLARAAAVEKQIDEVRESPIEIPPNSLHESLVQSALNAGEKVPAHVLAEYPDLRKEERKPSEKPKSFTDEEINGVKIINNVEENRLQLKFDGKPPENVREHLKSRGFRWAPSGGVWQRHLSAAAKYAGMEAAKMMGEAGDGGDTTLEKAKQDAPREPQVMSEEEYLSQNGASRLGIGDAALHKNKGRHSDKTWRKIVGHQTEKDRALLQRREELRSEYKKKLKDGTLRAPSRIERLMKIAKGHEDVESTQAARRLLKKRGIDWKS